MPTGSDFKKGGRKTPKPLDLEGLMNYSARILTVRAVTTAELRTKLVRRAAQRTDIDEVIRRLKDVGYLNDQTFATSFAGWRRDNQGLGKTRVMHDLLARRVAPDLAKETAEAAFSGVDESVMIQQFLERKYRGKDLRALLDSKNPDKEKHLASAFRKLRAGGFSSANSIKVLKRYSAHLDDAAEGLEDLADTDDTSAV